MTQKPNARIPIGYSFDPRGGQQFIQQTKNTTQALGALQAEMTKQGVTAEEYARRTVQYLEAENRAAQATQRLGNATTTASSRLREKIAAARASITTDVEQTRAIENQTRALQRYQAVQAQQAQFAAAALPEPSFAAVTGGGGRTRRRTLGGLGTFGTAVRNLPDVGPSTEIANVLIGVDRITGALGISATAAAAALGAMAAATVVVTGAIGVYNNITKDQSDSLISLARSQERYFRALREDTTSEARAQLQDAENRLADAQAQRTELQGELDKRFAREQSLFLGDVGARIRTGIQTVFSAGEEEIITRLAQLDADILTATGDINRFSEGLQENAFVVNDMVELFRGRFTGAIEGVTSIVGRFVDEHQERIQGIVATTDQEIATNRKIIELRRNFSLDRLAQLRQENADEQAFNRERIRRLEQFEGRSTAADEELARLRARENELLREAVLLHDPYIRQLEQEARFLNEISRVGAVFGRVFGAIRDDLSGLDVSKQLQRIAEIEKRRDEQIAEIQDRRREREAQAEDEYNKAIADADRRAADDRLKLFEDNYKRIIEIERRFSRSYTQAVGERDALAAYNARIAREDELRELKENNERREKEIQETLERERQIAEDRRRETLRIAADTADKEIAKARQKAQAEIDIQNQSIQHQVAQAFQFTNTLNTVFNTGYTQMLNNAQTFANNISSIFLGSQTTSGGAVGNLINSILGGGSGGSSGSQGTPVQVPLPGGGSQPGWSVPVTPIYPGQPGYVVQYSPVIQGQSAQAVQRQIDQNTRELVQLVYGGSARR